MAQEQIVLPADHFKKRVRQQYNNVEKAIVREVLQNSQDAGATHVLFDIGMGTSPTNKHTRYYRASDNGHGMDIEAFRNFFLTLGGTKKNTNSIGGFGAAKEVLAFCWDEWYAAGQGFRVIGHGASTPESELQNGRKNGFEIGAYDDDLDIHTMMHAVDEIVSLSSLDLKVSIDGTICQMHCASGRKLRRNQLVKTFHFGNLYVVKSGHNAQENPGYLYIRTHGLYTSHEYVGTDYVFYLELTGAPWQALTENRDGLRNDVRNTISETISAIVANPASVEKRFHPRIEFFGQTNIFNSERCYRGDDKVRGGGQWGDKLWETNTYSPIWKAPMCVAVEQKNRPRMVTKDGWLRPRYAKAMEILTGTVSEATKYLNTYLPILGLYISDNNDVGGVHARVATAMDIIAVSPEILLSSHPFYVTETIVHELAHRKRDSHSQEFEQARMEFMRQLAPHMAELAETVERLQQLPERRGKYWESEIVQQEENENGC